MSCHEIAKFNDRHVLLVTSHDDSSDSISHLLRTSGYAVVAVKNCAEAMENGARRNFDLYLIEISLPDGDGCGLLRRLLKLKAVPAIALLGYPKEEDITRCFLAGFNNYLVKPVLGDRLQEVLNGAFAFDDQQPLPV